VKHARLVIYEVCKSIIVYIETVKKLKQLHEFRALQLHKLVLKVPHRVALDAQLAMRVPVTHELESIFGPIVQFVVFEAHVFEQLHEMQPRAWVDGRDGAVYLAVLEP